MDPCRTGRVLHLGAGGPGAAIGDVVFDRVVEQHRVLRHDAYGLPQAGLGHAADVLAVDGDAAVRPARPNVVEAEQQARQGGLARARRPDHSHGFARRNLEADLVQDGPRGLVRKRHVLKPHGGCTLHLQRGRAGCIGNLALLLHQREHLVQIGQALFDLAVQHTQKPQRDIELDHESVNHHQVAQRHAAVHHTLGGAPQHRHQTNRNDGLLTSIEQAQRALALDGDLAVTLQVFVVAPRLEVFVVEVLHCLEVQQ